MSYSEKLRYFNLRKDYKDEAFLLTNSIKAAVRGSVLDVGCGLGEIIKILEGDGINAFGVEPRCDLISNLQGKKAVQSVGEHLPFKDKSFSSVFFMHSIAHVEDSNRSIEEARRVLLDNGTLFVITPNLYFEKIIGPLKKVLEKAGKYIPDITVITHYSPKLLRVLLSEQFKEVHISTFGKFGFQRLIASAKP